MTQTSVSPSWWSVSAVRRYVAAYGIDALVDGAFFVLLGWTAAQSLSQHAAVGVIAAASVLKLTSLILVGGALSDRWGAAAVARNTLLVRTALLAALSTLLIQATPATWALCAIAGVYGAVDGLHDPAIEALSTAVRGAPRTQRSLQGVLVAVREVGLLVAGPAVGGILLAASATAAASALAALLLLAWLLVVSLQRNEDAASENDAPLIPGARLFSAARQGWAEAWLRPDLRLMLGVFLFANIALTPPVAVGVPLLAKLHGWTSLQFGLVDAGYALGALGGGLLIGRMGDQLAHPVRLALLSLVPTAIAIAIVGWLDHWIAAAALFTAAGVSTGVGPSLLGGAIKEATPAGLQGRVQAVRASAIVAGGPIGFAVFAVLSEMFSTPAALSALGAFLGMAVLVALGGLEHSRP